jgi:hypothetical protein
MGLGHARSAAEIVVDELYERMLGVGHQLVARDELPRNAEEFAQAVVHVVFDALAAGLGMVNEYQLAPRLSAPDAPGRPSPAADQCQEAGRRAS